MEEAEAERLKEEEELDDSPEPCSD